MQAIDQFSVFPLARSWLRPRKHRREDKRMKYTGKRKPAGNADD